MSTRPTTTTDPNRSRSRKAIESPQKNNVKHLSQKDLDSSCHRLSRIPQTYTHNKVVIQEQAESFTTSYYRDNPDDIDERRPDEKLQEIQERLGEDLEKKEKFELLVQQKQLTYFLYGDDSIEMLRSYKDLGIYYNQNERPASAIRHLKKANELEKQFPLDNYESTEIAVETAEAYYTLSQDDRTEDPNKFLVQTNNVLRPVLSYNLEEQNSQENGEENEQSEENHDEKKKNSKQDGVNLMYRRDLANARALSKRNKAKEAIQPYEKARDYLEVISGAETEEMADLYVEMAENTERSGNQKPKSPSRKDKMYRPESTESDLGGSNYGSGGSEKQTAAQYYKKAYDIYISLNLESKAKAIESKLPKEGNEEEEENTERPPLPLGEDESQDDEEHVTREVKEETKENKVNEDEKKEEDKSKGLLGNLASEMAEALGDDDDSSDSEKGKAESEEEKPKHDDAKPNEDNAQDGKSEHHVSSDDFEPESEN